jgi:hypothetical protein
VNIYIYIYIYIYPRFTDLDSTYPLHKSWADFRVGMDDMNKWKFLTLPGLEPRPLCFLSRGQLLEMVKCSEWMYSYTTLDLGAGWRWEVSFTLWPFSRRKSRQYPLGSSLCQPHSQSRRCGEIKTFTAANRNRAIKPVFRRFTDWADRILSLNI